MAEHQIDRVAGRHQPVPQPLPACGVDVLDVVPDSVRHRRIGRRGKPSPQVRRALRSKSGRRALIPLACLAVLVIGLVVSGFLSSPAPSVGAPDAVGGSAAASSSPSPADAGPAAVASAGLVGDPVSRLSGKFPYNPLNHLGGAGLHDVTLVVTSRRPIGVLGYLVPTGLGSPSGVVKQHPTRWSYTEKAVGPGYLAAIFMQAGRGGAPVTCTVIVDGNVTNTSSTSGSYGRGVCLG